MELSKRKRKDRGAELQTRRKRKNLSLLRKSASALLLRH